LLDLKLLKKWQSLKFVFVPEKDKIPFVAKWTEQGIPTDKDIENWIDNFPLSNFGIVTGLSSNVIVLDIDIKNNQPGLMALADIESKYGPNFKNTLIIKTPSGGAHYYYKYPSDIEQIKCRQMLEAWQGIELKGDGGKISFGEGYSVIRGSWDSIADCPAWLIKIIKNYNAAPKEKPKEKITLSDGERDSGLTSIAGSYRKKGFDRDKISLLLQKDNLTKCINPLSEEQVEKIVNSVCKYKPDEDWHNCTDLGNAERLKDYVQGDVVYCDDMNSWLYYEGGVWKKDRIRQIERYAQDVIREAYAEVSNIKDADERKKVAKFLMASENANRQGNMVKLLKPMLPVTTDELDSNKHLFNCANGTLNLETGELQAHDPKEFHTKKSPINWNSEATCENFKKWFLEIFENNEELAKYVQKVLGRCLSSNTGEQEFYVLFGEGKNGKSTLMQVITAILSEYTRGLQANQLMTKGMEDNAPYLAQLKNVRALFCSESESRKKLNGGLIKMLTGGESITTRQKYEKPITFNPELKLFLITNHKPIIDDASEGMWRRIRLIPFKYRIPDDKTIPNYENLLLQEAEGILQWLYEGYQLWRVEGLDAVQEVKAETKEYKNEEDVIGLFADECLVEDGNNKESSKDLYQAFIQWGIESGEYTKGTSKKVFIQKLKMIFGPALKEHRTNTERGWKGIKLNIVTEDHGF
jgi:putative DNA primase/helicase